MLFVPYIMFNGNASEALKFYAEIFQSDKDPNIMLYGDAKDMMELPPGYEDKILHTELSFPGGLIYMSDAFPGAEVNYTDAISFNLGAESKEELNRLFTALSDGGKVLQPLEEQFWGAIFGSVNDRYGIHWSFNYQLPKE